MTLYRPKRRALLLGACGAACLPGHGLSAPPAMVKYVRWDFDRARGAYHFELIQAVLSATVSSHGPFTLVPVTMPMSPERLLVELIRGDLIHILCNDVVHPELNRQAIRVPIATDKGLLGHRVLMIRHEDRGRFASIRDIAQLKAMSLGQQSGWGDISVLRHHGFRVVEGSNYLTLFDMLMARRFDAFPRAVSEAPQELAAYGPHTRGLEIEPTLMLHYPLPVYYYVNRSQPVLANRVMAGLEKIKADGSWDTLFERHFKASVDSLRIDERRTFRLDNPFLPADVVKELAAQR